MRDLVKHWGRLALAGALACGPLAAAAHGPQGERAAATVATTAAPPVAARYRVELSMRRPKGGYATSVHRLQLVRQRDAVEYVKGAQEEIWRRDAAGGIHLERVFRRDRQVVDYPAAELRALGIEADWHALGTLVDERDLAALRRIERPAADGTVRYRGTLHGDRVELAWKPAIRLPVELRRERANGDRVRYRLLEAHASAPAAWPRAGADTADFRRLDAADFGDMEYDAFVRQAQARDVRAGWRAGHAH